jgi:hypothetical protein
MIDYWLVAPLIGIVSTTPAWAWLFWPLLRRKRKMPPE